jgi:hypothetical protein
MHRARMLDQRPRRTCATSSSYYPYYYGKDIRRTISSVRALHAQAAGDLDVAKAQGSSRGRRRRQAATMEAARWLLGTRSPAEADAKAERKADRAARDEQGQRDRRCRELHHVATPTVRTCCCVGSPRRRGDARVADPGAADLDLIPKLVTGLLAHRKAGRWLNTQENTFALLAMDRYFQTYEKVDARLRGARLARRRLRRRARVQGPLDRLLRDRHPDEGRRDARQAGADDPEGRRGPALLPDRHDLRAGNLKLAAGRLRLRGDSARTRASTIRRTSSGTPTGVWTIKAGAACGAAQRWSTRTGATTSRSSIRCRPASSR